MALALAPRGLRRAKQHPGRARGGAEILRQRQGADLAVAALHPFVAEYQPRQARAVHKQGPVQTGPIPGRHGSRRPGRKRSQRAVGAEDGRAAGAVRALEGREHIGSAAEGMHLRGPEVPVRPEAVAAVEAFPRPLPVLQVPAHVHVKPVRGSPAGRAAGAVEVVDAVLGQYVGIADVDFVQSHGDLRGIWIREWRVGSRVVADAGHVNSDSLNSPFRGAVSRKAD